MRISFVYKLRPLSTNFKYVVLVNLFCHLKGTIRVYALVSQMSATSIELLVWLPLIYFD